MRYANQLDSCVAVLEKAVTKFEGKSNDSVYTNQVGTLYQSLGLAYRDKSDFVGAAESFHHAAVQFDKGGDQKNQLAAKYNQANLLTRLNNFKQAEKTYAELLEITDSPVVHVVVYSSLGILNMKQDNYTEALNYLEKCEALIEYISQPELVYLNQGIAHREMGNFDVSLKKLLQAEEICKSKNRKQSLTLIYNNLVKVNFEMGNLDQTQYYIGLAEKYIAPSNLSQLGVLYETKSKIYERKGDWKNAFDFLILKQIYKDSIESVQRMKAITEIETKYQTEKKEAENQLLKKDKALQAATIQRQQTTLWATAAGVGFLALISFLLYHQNVERKRKNASLAEQKTALAKKNEHIETLHKELAHRVKNNLFFISTLMKMQGKRLENSEAKQAVKEGEARIEAMSLLHRKLHLANNETDVNIGEYLKELCANLQNSFPHSGTQPQIKVTTDEILVEGEPAVRIGLIVNELVTNSFKYAFKNQENPQINVTVKKMNDAEYQLAYRDNGIGIPANFDISKSQSMGLKLINTLTKQLNGTVEVSNQDGACFEFSFKQRKIVA